MNYFEGIRGAIIIAALALACAVSRAQVELATFDGNVLVGRPTDQGASISVMAFSASHVLVEYGSASGAYDSNTDAHSIGADQLHVFEICDLKSDTEYFYRIRFGADDPQQMKAGAEYSFNTSRSAGSSFNFAIQADPHLGARTRFEKWCGDRCTREGSDDKVYAVTAANMRTYHPDFVVDLGDTFMTTASSIRKFRSHPEPAASSPVNS